ncbi:helix-turn-helix domain-containing protein [Metabacillus fastidiosus]|uniref:Helix-turn-helix transcriptional regulator n=1 Tax=Metabacillus fastidiosus TaxID=1458 RepID=A0ABU6NTK4_9BACI|nr:helix-turn-helix transcriptional regulator [Metabacillus fastidiosus]
MKECTKCKKVELIVEGERLKRLREYYQISRDVIASEMSISKSKLDMLENGEVVRDTRTLLNFYDLIIENHVLALMYEEECFGMEDPIEDPHLVEQQILNDIRKEILIKDLDKNEIDKFHLDSINEISNQRNSKNTRLNSRKIIYI